ncbi:hypothetical protein QBC47DRAFT_415702 [Echria macrotheca]|uniref:SWR1-complex protein 3 domain-containing protein n=1 Tax=Echria macrotheca TaxID=438768 RepID=A0AAJ0F9B6_9PEZI|nr:hypothetical protein QBC47DRAFT_415702 [Echria macrotheca]
MERKRKLPARAAARGELPSKKRMTRPSTAAQASSLRKSETPVPDRSEPESTPVEEPPPSLPQSIVPGKPLPTVDAPQPDDLPPKDYQSVSESGVLAESLTRSRQKWISDCIFEKYWTKPVKRKGVVIEEPNNPPKESMTKLGAVTITVEPHVFEATMYAVKDPKPRPPPPTGRPALLYGPPNGVLPPHLLNQNTPKQSPSTATATPSPGPTRPSTPAASRPQLSAQLANETVIQQAAQQAPSAPPPPKQAPPPTAPPAPDAPKSTPMTAVAGTRPPVASPRGMESVLHSIPPQPTPIPPTAVPPIAQPQRPPAAPGVQPGTGALPTTPTVSKTTAPGQKPSADPIILTLAEKAGEDPHLRDLMKRVAQGDAAKHELERFQAIIDAITTESKRKGAPVGPSADRLLVDGRSVRYFADEVRAILGIVLSSRPNQTSADLRPPVGSDPLVVALVKAALDDVKTSDIVKRIASDKPLFSDATELKVILDRLRTKLLQEREAQQKAQSPQPASSAAAAKPPSGPNGHVSTPPAASSNAAQQALRSKGPPPPPKPEISAVVFEFSGGSGDRFLFPKFSVVEYVPTPAGQQVIASFLVVRKGSKSEYPMADPELDYYQPVTVRFFTPLGRHLENLARVVAPQEEVRRYMDDIMDKMTRAEYILLAMRLPRAEGKDGEAAEEKEKEEQVNGGDKQHGDAELVTPKAGNQVQPMAVLWGTSKTSKSDFKELSRSKHSRMGDVEDQQYQSFISTISRKEPKEA